MRAVGGKSQPLFDAHLNRVPSFLGGLGHLAAAARKDMSAITRSECRGLKWRVSHWGELPELDSRLTEHCGCVAVHTVAIRVDYLTDADLANLDAAREAWTGITVDNGALTDPIPTRLEQGVLLGMNAQACGQTDARAVALIAARTTSFGAVLEATRCPIVASADDASFTTYEHATNAPLHAV